MNGLMAGLKGGWTDGQENKRTNEWKDGCMEVNTETWVNKWWEMQEQVGTVETRGEVTGWLTEDIDR